MRSFWWYTKGMEKRFYRSKKDRQVAGVCGGFAEYFKIDPVFVRAAFLALAFCGGVGVAIYVAFWLIAPDNPDQ